MRQWSSSIGVRRRVLRLRRAPIRAEDELRDDSSCRTTLLLGGPFAGTPLGASDAACGCELARNPRHDLPKSLVTALGVAW